MHKVLGKNKNMKGWRILKDLLHEKFISSPSVHTKVPIAAEYLYLVVEGTTIASYFIYND